MPKSKLLQNFRMRTIAGNASDKSKAVNVPSNRLLRVIRAKKTSCYPILDDSPDRELRAMSVDSRQSGSTCA